MTTRTGTPTRFANLANRSYDAYQIGLPRGGLWRVRFNGDWNGYSDSFTNHPSHDLTARWNAGHDGMAFTGEVSVGPYTAIMLSQDS